MATNSNVKKSLIPRPPHDCGSSQAKSKQKIFGKLSKEKQTQSNHPNQRSGPHDGLREEDEDSVRRSLVQLEADNARMKKTLEQTVMEAEENLETMRRLMEEKEKRQADLFKSTTEENEELQQQLKTAEETLIENNIDPATGEVIQPSEEQAATVEKVKKITKGDVTKMREQLQQMNEKSDKYLIDVQTILQDIAELEASSERAQGPAPKEPLSVKEMEILIREVEEVQRKEEAERQKAKKDKNLGEGEDEEGSDVSDQESASSSPEPDEKKEKDDQKPQDQSKVFLTQK